MPGPGDDGLFDGVGVAVLIGIVVVALLFLGVLALIVVSSVKRYRAAKSAGLDPFAADVQVMGALANSAALAPDRPIAERLAEIEALYRAGQITAAEREAARARILGTG